jgi:hypothetical protein
MPLRFVFLGLRCGLTERESWLTTPGRILTLWRWTLEYDEYLHGIERNRQRPGGED